jgi:hypothetical protein
MRKALKLGLPMIMLRVNMRAGGDPDCGPA